MPLNFGQQNQTIDSIYAEMAKLKAMQPTQPMAYRTVFNDIADEWASCSDAEKEFINKDDAYLQANLTYQQQFNAFLIDMVGVQFINSPYGKSAESALVALKDAKARFKKLTSDNIASIKAENAELQRQVEELRKLIED